jgi:hypothetical protein
MVDAGHRRDLPLDSGSVDHEEGLDQVAGGEAMFPNETPDRLGAAEPAGTMELLQGHGGKD